MIQVQIEIIIIIILKETIQVKVETIIQIDKIIINRI